MTEKGKEPESPAGHPLALDPLAESGSRTEPAFIARPAGAPVYHGFEVLSDVVVGEFLAHRPLSPQTQGFWNASSRTPWSKVGHL